VRSAEHAVSPALGFGYMLETGGAKAVQLRYHGVNNCSR